jgi:ubiquinone/menaquinone biosynthesis C-methylase UbiE
MARLDYDQVADSYHAGRGVPLEHLVGWRSAVGTHVDDGAGRAPLLDLGAGTGIWTAAFRHWFEVPVVAVEPSAGMRQVARDNGVPDGAWLVAGRAEAIPLDSSTVGTVWMSTVVHHVEDLGECARELARVLRADGRILIRSSFPGRHDEIMLFHYFPAAKRVAESFPTVEDLRQLFAQVSFELRELQRVREPAPGSLQDLRELVVHMRSTDSALAPLTDAEFDAGLAAIDADVAREVAPAPLGLDLLVFARR